jgi:hypothetical protein
MMAATIPTNTAINTPRLLAWAALALGVGWSGWAVATWRAEARADAEADRLWRRVQTTSDPSAQQALVETARALHGRPGPPWVTLVKQGGVAVFLVAGGAALLKATVPGWALKLDAPAGDNMDDESMDRAKRTDHGG